MRFPVAISICLLSALPACDQTLFGRFTRDVPGTAGSCDTGEVACAADEVCDPVAHVCKPAPLSPAGRIDLLAGRTYFATDKSGELAPLGIFAGDFDGAAGRELLSVNAGGFALLWSIGSDGELGYLRAAQLPVTQPIAVTALDIDGDGKTELACGDANGVKLCRLLSAGFECGPAVKPADGVPVALAAAELDATPGAELLVATTNGVQSFGRDDANKLKSGVLVRGAGGTGGIAVGTIAGSARAGAVTINPGSTGGPTYAVLRPTDAPSYLTYGNGVSTGSLTPKAVTLVDLNRDGSSDLVLAYRNEIGAGGTFTSGVAVALAKPDEPGVFQPLVTTALPCTITTVAAAELTGDDQPDIAAGGGDCRGVWVIGNQNGVLGTPRRVATPGIAAALTALEATGDARLDLAVADASTYQALTVLAGSADGVHGARTLESGQPPLGIAAGELTGDRYDDLALLFGEGNGARIERVDLFSETGERATLKTTLAGAGGVGVGDFDGDGTQDVAMCTLDGNVTVLLRPAAGAERATEAQFPTIAGPCAVLAAELTGDNKRELVVAAGQDPGRLFVLSPGEPGGAPWGELPLGKGPRTLATGDFDGDGRVDVVVAQRGAPDLTLLLQKETRQLALGLSIVDAMRLSAPASIAVADFGLGAAPDIAVVNFQGGTMSPPVLYFGSDEVGAIGKQVTSIGAIGPSPDSVVAADLNDDGATDMCITESTTGVVWVYQNLADGTGRFRPPRAFAVGLGAAGLVSRNFGGNARLDLAVVTNDAKNGLSVLRNVSQ